jgi:hypothetical protein
LFIFQTISFDEGEYFIMHQTSAKQRNWWQVINMKGNIGFVPSNYVTRLQVSGYPCILFLWPKFPKKLSKLKGVIPKITNFGSMNLKF